MSDEEDAGHFKANLSDPRFSKLFTSHDYALDPTDPRFSRSLGAKDIASEVRGSADGVGGWAQGDVEPALVV